VTSPASTADNSELTGREPASNAPAGSEPASSEPAGGELAAQAWQAMRALVLDRYDRRKPVCEALGMSFIRAKALRRIADQPLTMRDLAAGLGTDPGYTTVVVDDLERRGLVTRTVSAGDRRSKIVSITPAGAQQAGRAGQILGDPPGPVRDLAPDDLASLARILTALLEAEA
jgi:DNA-binding MarR family transcriptional regulator